MFHTTLLVARGLFSFGEDVVLDLPQHRQEPIPIEFETGHVLLDATRDLVERDKEGQLALSERVEEFVVIVSDPEDRNTIGDELHGAQVDVDVAVPAKVIPRPAHALHGHAVVEQAPDDTQRNEITKRVQALDSRPTAGLLERRLYKLNSIPVPKLVRAYSSSASKPAER